MRLYVDTKPDEPMDANTAERFRVVEVPVDTTLSGEYYDGYNDCVTEITRNIKSAIGAGEGDKSWKQ